MIDLNHPKGLNIDGWFLVYNSLNEEIGTLRVNVEVSPDVFMMDKLNEFNVHNSDDDLYKSYKCNDDRYNDNYNEFDGDNLSR